MSLYIVAFWLLGAGVLLALGFVNANHDEFRPGSGPAAALAYIFWPISLLLVALFAVYEGLVGAQSGANGSKSGQD